MRRTPWAACFWPGFPQLWAEGSWSALALAVGFGVGLDVALVATFVWTDWIGSNGKLIVWGGLALVWLLALAAQWRSRSLARERAAAGEGDTTDDNLFSLAQAQYLQGNWLETESILRRLVQQCSDDVESQLMLATLYRHTGRLGEASECLKRLELLEHSSSWQHEVEEERRELAAAGQPTLQEASAGGAGSFATEET